MTRKTINELYAQVAASFPDNSSGLITPALLRAFCQDFLDTVRPSYGAMSLTTPLVKAVTTVNSSFAWEAVIAAQAPDYTCSLPGGIITRSGGPASGRISLTIDAIAPNNTILTFTLFIDGVATPWATSNTSTSATDVQSYAFMAINYSANLAPTYQIQVKSNASGNITLQNAVFVVENVPVNTN